jgi:hypothetical protein
MRDVGGGHVLEAFSGGMRLHLARLEARDAFALEAQLREAIAETCGVVLSQELVPLSRPGVRTIARGS